jgi:SAM-dependent methyltransferase
MDFRKFYDEQSDYAAFRSDPERHEEYKMKTGWKAENLVSLIPEDHKFRTILEVGCALGILLDNIAGRLGIQDYTGIDISGKNIETARSLFPVGKFYQGTLEEVINSNPLEVSPLKFDLVILSDVIEHIPDDTGFLKAVKNISDHVLVNLPLEKSFKNRNRKYGENDPSGHLRWYDRAMAGKLFEEAGFTIVKGFTLNPLFNRAYFEFYKQKRDERISKKTSLRRIFWTSFYAGEDRIKWISKVLYEKINGTNYFVLLKAVR